MVGPSLAGRSARVGACCALAAIGLCPAAVALDCSPPGDTSTCVDADNLWVRPTPARFAAVGADVPETATLVSVIRAGYALRPIVVTAPSPDPSGRELGVVTHTTSLTVGSAYVAVRRLAIGATLSIAPWRTGTGDSGIATTQREPLRAAALRDPKLHAALALLQGRRRRGADVTVGLDAALPLGSSYSGAASFVGAPWASLEWRRDRLLAGVELGARFQRTVAIAGTELGHQLAISAGLGYRCPEDAYGLTLELRALTPLAASERITPSGEVIDEVPVIAEALAAGWWYLDRSHHARASVAFGRGLPLARRSVDGAGEWLTAPTAPAFRAVLGVDLAFGAAR